MAAERDGWPLERLELEKEKVRGKEEHRRRRRPLPTFVKTVHGLARALADPERCFSEVDQIDRLDDDEMDARRKVVSSARRQLETLEAKFGPARQEGHVP